MFVLIYISTNAISTWNFLLPGELSSLVTLRLMIPLLVQKHGDTFDQPLVDVILVLNVHRL